MLLAAVCAFASCDPVSEDISNGGHITAEELRSQSTVTLDGNVVTCNTSAPVNAKWTIAGKDLIGNYAWKKLKLGDQTITLTGICADGTELTADFPVNVTTITDPLEKYYIYGPNAEPLVMSQCPTGPIFSRFLIRAERVLDSAIFDVRAIEHFIGEFYAAHSGQQM